MPRISLDISWLITEKQSETIDPVLFQLLTAIRETGSLRAASESLEISYRNAWGLVRRWSKLLGAAVVNLEKGRGASLTEFGEKLLVTSEMVRKQFAPSLQEVADQFNREFARFQHGKKLTNRLRINASHGLAISEFCSLCKKNAHIDIDFHFRGSLESLRELANHRCEIAGFHFPRGKIGQKLAPRYLQWLDPEKHRLIHLSIRKQGLIVPARTPQKVTDLKSLTRRPVKIINRQPESGTRVLFDELILDAGINKSAIRGYQDEEFTHLAVAAMVASGMVDAGFGIKAAASKFNLHFIEIIDEFYLLAIDKNVANSAINSLTKILQSRDFRNQVKTLPGYDATRAGEAMSFADVFENS